MWRGIGLGALVVAMGVALAACDGGDDRSQPCTLETEDLAAFATSSNQALPTTTLEEARRRSQFGVGVPDELPEGVSLTGIAIDADPGCPDERIRGLVLAFSGPGYSFTLEEQGGGFGTVVDSEPFHFNDMEGRVFRRTGDDGRQLVAFHWTDQERGYSAYTFLDGGLTEERFLEILESIPE